MNSKASMLFKQSKKLSIKKTKLFFTFQHKTEIKMSLFNFGMNKDKLTTQIVMNLLYQLIYLALCWRSPYFVNIFARVFKKRLYASRLTHKAEGHFKVWATIIFFQRPLLPTPRAETGLPLSQSIRMQAWVSSIRSLAGRAESTTSPILCSKCHDRYPNPHPADQTPVLESGTLNRSAMTLPVRSHTTVNCHVARDHTQVYDKTCRGLP